MEAEPETLLAARLLELATEAGTNGPAFIARSGTRAARPHAAFAPLAGSEAEGLALPAGECLSYHRIPPSRAVVGVRMATVARLAAPAGRSRLLVLSVEAAEASQPRRRGRREATA